MLMATLAQGLLLLLLAEPLAGFAGEPRLAELLPLLALSLLPGPFERPAQAMMRRELHFAEIATVNVSTVLMNAATMIMLALQGFGGLSFGWGAIVGSTTALVMTFYFRPQFASLRPSLRGWREIVRFAAYANSTAVLLQLNELVPSLVLARFLSIASVGAYNRTNTVAQLPSKAILSAVSPIALSALAKESREGRDLTKAMLHMFELLSAVLWPALVLLSLLAPVLVPLLLGEQWRPIIPLLHILPIAMLPTLVATGSYLLLTAIGGVRQCLISVAIFAPFSLVIIVISASHGLTTFVASLFVVYLLQAVTALWAVRQLIEFRYRDVAWSLSKSLPAVALSAAGVTATALLLSGSLDMSVPEAAMAGMTGLAGWLLGLRLNSNTLWTELKHGLANVRQHLAAGRLKTGPLQPAVPERSPRRPTLP